MEIKYNDTFSTSHSSDDVFDFIEKDTTLLDGPRNEVTLVSTPTEVSLNETLYSGYEPQNIQLDEPESSLIKGSSIEIKPILLSNPDVNAQAAFAKSHTRDFYKGRSFRYAGKWEEGVHYINDEYITDFVVKDQVLLVCKKSNMSSWKNNPTEWIYDGDRIVAVVSDYWEVVLAGGIRGKTYLPEYDELSDSLIWRLVDPEHLPQEFQTYLGIRDYVDYALVPIQEKLNDVESDIDITKRELDSLENDIINLDNNLTNLEIVTGRISTHVEDLEGNFSDFVQTAEGFFFKVGDLENNVGQLWLTSQQFGVQLENAEGDISRLTIQADQISTRVENAEGDISQINQRADEISTQVENQQGDISRISQRADQIQSEVENQQGDISRITQRADIIESQVQNLDGDVSTITQRADQIQSQVENIEGDVSTISQKADLIEVQVQNQEGDISRISQTASEIQSEVENLNGDVSILSQTADEISARVTNTEGDISVLSQRADEISSEVSNIEGDISTISQRADQIQSQVENVEGDISTITQRADLIETQVQNIEGDVSTISQRADSIELEVLNQQGDISDIRQTADAINLRVENAEEDIATLDIRSDQITSTVRDQQNQISQIRQTSSEIASEVAANKVDADNKYTETNSRITQTASAINLEVARVEGKVDTNARTFTEAVNDLQNQIDGAIDTWFYNYAPVHTDVHGVPDSQVPLNVAPYSEWVAAETVEEPEKVRDSHVSDIFYDQHSGYAYRFIGTGNPGSRVYTWVVIQDSAVIKALEDAARAQDTADNKRRVFVVTPYAPYDLGDLWVKTTTVGNVAATELYRCIIAKTTAGTENIATDWAVADSYAKEVSKSNIQILADAIVQQTVHYEYDEYGRLTNDTKSAITTGMNDISLAITGSKLETVGIFIRNANVNDNHINLIADKVRIKGTGDHTPTALSIIWDSAANSYKIDVASLNVNGIFSTSPGSVWSSQKSDVLTTSQGYANTAQSNAESTALGYANTAESNAKTAAQGYADAAQSNAISTAATNAATYITNNVIPLINAVDGRVDGLGYLATALNNGTTAIGGGLVLTSLVGLGGNSGTGGAWELWSGMNGQYNSSAFGHGIGAWYGGDNVDKATLTSEEIEEGWSVHRWARSLFRLDGSGYLANNNIWWGASGELHIGANTIIGDSGSMTFNQLASTVAELASYFEVIEVPSGASYVPYLKLKGSGTGFKGFVVDGFISASGVSPSSGSEGTTLEAVWGSLINDSPITPGYNTKISSAHIPIGDGLSVDNNGKIYVTSPGLITSVAGVSPINSDIPAYLLSSALGLNTAAGYDVTNVVTAGDTTHLVTSAAVATAVAAVLKWKGITTTDVEANPSANPIIINGQSYTAVMGDVVVLSGTSTEYLYNGSTWEPMGDEASYALKTITITGTGYLTGGGTLEANRTLDITSSAKTKIDNGATAYGYFSNGVLVNTHLPAMYIGKTAVQFTSATQDLTGIGNVMLDNAKYLQAYNSAGDTLYNLAGLTSSNYGYFGAANSPRTYVRGQVLYFLTGNSGNTSALTISNTQNATFYGAIYLQNNKSVYAKNKPAEGAGEVSIGILNLDSSNQLKLGSGLIATGENARAYNTFIYGGSINFYTGDSTNGSTKKWIISASGNLYPNTPSGTYNIGASSNYIKYGYIQRIYLAANTYLEVDSNGYVHLVTPSGKGFYCDGFISAGGLSTGGGSTGIDALAMWKLLTNNQSLTSYDNNTKIATAHIPDMASTYGYLKSADISDMATKTWVATQNFSTVANTVSNVAVGGSGHTEELAITKGGSTSYLTVPYATNTPRFKRYDGTLDMQGGYDLNTLLTGGGITSQYNSVYTWGNGPDGMSYGGAVQLNPFVGQTLAMQLAWDIDHTNVKTGHLWWRDSIYKNNTHTWGEWRLVYDSVTLSKSVVTGLLDAGSGTYLPLSGGTMSGDITIPNGKAIVAASTKWMLGINEQGTLFYCGPGYEISAGFLLRSGNINLVHRKFTATNTYNDYAIWDSSNTYVSNSALTIGSLSLGSSTSPIGYATQMKRPWAVEGTQEAGGFDLNTALAGGGAIRNVHSSTYWAHAPVGATYFGMAWQINPTSAENGAMQFYWDGSWNSTTNPTGGLWWRLRNNAGWADDWHRIYDSANANLSTIDWACKDLSAAGNITLANNKYIRWMSNPAAGASPEAIIAIEFTTGNNLYIGYGVAVSGHYTRLYGNTIDFLTGSSTRTTAFLLSDSDAKMYRTFVPSINNRYDLGSSELKWGTIWASTGICSDGYVSAGGVSSSSDARLKKNIKDFNYSAELLMSLKPREWDWNGKTPMNGHAAGFVAQEVEPHLPYAVTERTYKQLTYDIFHALEVSALQDHETRIQVLERENRELKDEIKRLKTI